MKKIETKWEIDETGFVDLKTVVIRLALMVVRMPGRSQHCHLRTAPESTRFSRESCGNCLVGVRPSSCRRLEYESSEH